MFTFFDPMYFVFLAPAMLLAGWAQWRVHSAYNSASKVRSRSDICGAEAADAVLQAAQVRDVQIEPTGGHLTDHYVPGEKILRLSHEVYAGRSLAALGIAAHEAGHAMQDAEHYPLLKMRNALVPMASIGGNASWIAMTVGFVLAALHSLTLAKIFLLVGIAGFSVTVFFQLVNLPVEFDASRRARKALLSTGLVTEVEDVTVRKVLNAAAWTYVAGTLSSALTLAYYLYRSGLLGGRDE